MSLPTPYTILKNRIESLGISCDVTCRTLSLGDADTITGWYAKSFSESAIEMIIVPAAARPLIASAGLYARHELTGFTISTVSEGDEILDANSNYYEIKAIQDVFLGDTLICKECQLIKVPLHADRPSTSGTWPSAGDPRYRTKVYLDTYLTAANMKEDNNSTNATTLTGMGTPDYPLKLVFLGTKNVDLIFSIEKPDSEALVGHDLATWGYREQVPINIMAVDKSGITAQRMVYAGEREVRRICETYPEGSVRRIRTISEGTVPMGSTVLYSTKIVMSYKRDTT